ncbi:uncharacterized protein METZ01_LOCUS134131 [marine metagenome]|uniref:EamA domain-containing protein n=1 Tax=marine metagenome TaxID=408172 RepID=A0A381YXT6_9ZZZZ|tara:strand:- start:238 stop:1134 length:897 start_codon:yes stop_codon:yes gene_type:complete
MARPTRNYASLGRVSAALAVVCWSAGNIMVARLDMPGIQIAFWRQLIGFGVYGLVFLLIGRRLTWRTVRLVIPAGVLLGLEIGVFFTALRTTTIANATIIGALQPILLLAVASRRYRETVTGWLFGASVVAVCGVVLVMWGASSEARWSPRGDLLALMAMVLFSTYFVVVKDIRASVDTFTLQTVAMIIGALTVFPLAAIEAGTPVLPVPSSRQFVWLLVLLAVPGTGHYLMNWAHLHVSLSVAGLLTLAIPVLSALGAWLILDQHLTPIQALGGVVVLGILVGVVRRDARLASREGI